MKTEREKMLAGEFYNPLDEDLSAGRLRARKLVRAFNGCGPEDEEGRQRVMKEMFGAVGEGVLIEPPFACDYGDNIYLGDRVFFNFNCCILDSGRVEIGEGTKFAPFVQIYTTTHPVEASLRREGAEYALSIRIGADVWLGGGAIICPGVTIGDGAVIGAGSVVTRDVPPESVAAGNPCRVIRRVE